MIIGVMGFLAVVSGLTYVAARVGEGGFRRLGVPTRWAWLVAIAAPFVLLVVPLVAPGTAPTSASTAPQASTIFELAPIVVGDAGSLGLGGWALPLLAALWGAASLGLALFLLGSHLGLLRRRGGWSTTEVAGRRVYVSVDQGPAVAGVLSPWIVVPRWVLDLPSAELEYVLLHEEEHVRARDNLLLSAALIFVVLAPWNPLAWLHLRGLRTAMEIDCDRRVLRRAPDRGTYGESLLTVAARSSGLSLGLAAFTEKRRSLKTRILAMTDRATRWTPVRSLLLLGLALVVGVQACYVESPILIISDDDDVADVVRALVAERGGEPIVVDTRGAAPPPPTLEPLEPEIPEPPAEVSTPRVEISTTERREPGDGDWRKRTTEELAQAPVFTPFTVAPRILNREEVIAALVAEYPPLLRDAGIGGTARVYFFIDEEGRVQNFRLDQSTGHEALDDAALAVADVYRFSPALNRDERTPVWVSFPITFQSR